MKIVHVEAGMHLYGGAQQVLYLTKGLRDRGGDNLLVCPPGSAIARAAAERGLAVRELPLRGDADLGFASRLRRLLRRERPDLVHLHSRRGADLLGGIAARLAGTPCVLSRRVDNPESAAWARIKYRLYDRVITISDGIRRVLLAEGVTPGRVVCVPSAVDAAPYAHACERDWFETEFGLPPGARVLGVIAQLIPRKGHRHLFAALPPLLERHPDLYVLCFGQGPLHDELDAAIAANGWRGRVRLTGFRADLARLLPCLYAVAHPAEMEGLGVSLLQTSAAGVPIVASRAGGIPEAVRDGVNGLLVPPADADALARALERLLADPAQAIELGRRGRELVRRDFSIDRMVEGNLRVYTAVLNERRP
ncbi:MAG: glycosyltransferase [Gammaproteobacteria bacterium]|nr:glycosyltransferase [Gammaproteobacteria bacterium]